MISSETRSKSNSQPLHYTHSLGTTCKRVDATIDGQLGSKDICVPTPTSTSRVKRGVRVGGPAPTNYCYSGCSGAKVI